MSQQQIYTGLWLDHSQSANLRPTLTLSAGDAQVLTAFLGFLVPLVGVQLWKLLAFGVHQYISPQRREDTLRRQLLVALRNNSGAGGSAWTFIQQAWAWKGHSRRALIRCAIWTAVALTYGILLAVLATFLPSLISDPAHDARLLVPSDNCGYFEYSGEELYTAWMNNTLAAANYASDCYGGSNGSLQCSTFAVPQLARLPSKSVSCPFADDVCLEGYDAYFMDSGYLDSLTDFGINFDGDERVKFRKTATCALLAQGGDYTKEDDDGLGYYYGPVAGSVLYDRTFFQPEALTDYPSAKYRLDSVTYFRDADDSSWEPIEELTQDNGDLSILFFAAQGMLFNGKFDDPLFSAHESYSDGQGIYRADNLGQAIACVDQFELCNPEEDECTGLVSSKDLENLRKDGPDLDLSDEQEVIAERFTRPASFALQMAQAVFGRGGSALQANRKATQNIQNQLPDDQWQRELDGWFDATLARLQLEVQNFASGAWGSASNDSMEGLGDEQEAMCEKQVTRGKAHDGTVNYRFVPLIVVIVLCCVILFLSLTLERAVCLLQKVLRKGVQRRENWIADGKFQLQRVLLANAGVEGWRNVERTVPWTMAESDEATTTSAERPQAKRDFSNADGHGLLRNMEYRDPPNYDPGRQ